MGGRITHHNAHARKLDDGIGEQEAADELPAALALEFAAGEDDEEADERGQLDDGGEGEQEAAATPQRAEGLVVAAVVFAGEGPARGVGDRGAALVQAQTLREGRACRRRHAVRHPVRGQERGEGQGRRCGEREGGVVSLVVCMRPMWWVDGDVVWEKWDAVLLQSCSCSGCRDPALPHDSWRV